jgi:hypothetical protein
MGYVKDLENIEMVRDDSMVTFMPERPILLDVCPALANARLFRGRSWKVSSQTCSTISQKSMNITASCSNSYMRSSEKNIPRSRVSRRRCPMLLYRSSYRDDEARPAGCDTVQRTSRCAFRWAGRSRLILPRSSTLLFEPFRAASRRAMLSWTSTMQVP